MSETPREITLEFLKKVVDLDELKSYARKRFDELLENESGSPMIKNFLPCNGLVTMEEIEELGDKQSKIINKIVEDTYHIILGRVIRLGDD